MRYSAEPSFDRSQQDLRVHRHACLGPAVHGVGDLAVDALQSFLQRQLVDGRGLGGYAAGEQSAGECCSDDCWFHDGSNQKL
jgi:hypothetical protein